MDFKQKIQDVTAGLKVLSENTPDTMKGVALIDGAGAKTNYLDAKTRELIALAVAVTTRCDGCIAFHSAAARKLGITNEEVSEALGVAINLNAGAALVYSTHVLEAMNQFGQ